MYINYGDRNFFELGRLVDSEHSDTCFDIIICNPYYEENENGELLYQFAECYVDINDTWINKEDTMSYIGMTEDNFDPILYALGCIDYYGFGNFGGTDYYYGNVLTKKEICNILKNRFIASDHLDIEW